MDDFEKELKEEFLNEALDLLESSESSFLELESNRQSQSVIEEIFRLAHNLKGTSRAVGFGQVAELTHKAENLILKLKEGEIKATEPVVTILLEFNDTVTKMIKDLSADMGTTFNTVDIENRLEAILNHPELDQEHSNNDTSESLDEWGEGQRENLESVWEEENDENHFNSPLRSEDAPELVKPLAVTKPKEETNDGAKGKSKKEETIRVALDKIDLLNNFVGELVILQTVLDQRSKDYIEDNLSKKSINQLGKLSKELQEISMSLRMIPLKSTFQKMSRIVRDTSKLLKRQVNLNLIGEDTEIDKSVLEQLSDPLVHIVRNAVDHGLEDGEERVAKGKSFEGRIQLIARHEGSHLVIEVSDDGKGINPDVIRKKAIEKGLINESVVISDQDIIQYIFHPGFSTKENLTEVSGRGVGLDVVKTNIEKMSGEVSLSSHIGQGSVFRIVLPLTLAIIDGLVVKCSEERYIVPMSQVHEFVKVEESTHEMVTGVGECLKLRGEVIPVFNLGNEFLSQADCERNEDITMVVRGMESVYSVRVNEIINQQQVVIKKIGSEIKNKKGFMGCSILGDGKPAFIVDLNELFESKIFSKNNQNIKQAS